MARNDRYHTDPTLTTELFVAYYPNESSNDEDCLSVPLSTLVTLYIVKFMEIRGESQSNVKVFLKSDESSDSKDAFSLKKDAVENYNLLTTDDQSSNDLINFCVLPALIVPDNKLCVTGLCSVLRRLLKTGNEEIQTFLGHQSSCLSAPAEVSSWTRYCEIDLPQTTLEFIKKHFKGETPEVELPLDFARFEEHMNQPIRMHNIRKRMGTMTSSVGLTSQEGTNKVLQNGRQVTLDEEGREVDPIELFARSQHIFAEGPDCLLSDLIIFPHLHLVLTKLFQIASEESVASKLPLTVQWFNRMKEIQSAENVLESLMEFNAETPCFLGNSTTFIKPEVPAISLYKSDPKRNNPASRIFTRQHEVERVLSKINESSHLKLLSSVEETATTDNSDEIVSDYPRNCSDLNNSTKIDWSSLPRDVHPMGGELPFDRIEKKCHQLENMAVAVLKLAQDGDRIVDFCSGGGHLGIVLAYLLPNSTVFLVENKEESLMRAVKRVERLGLKNCRFLQGNMDYFCGKFDIGVSLHACGVATDLVIQACIENNASFVSCPCCYGSVQQNHMLTYPRSKHFNQQAISFQEYLVLGHTADQTHVTNDKHNQGQFAMDVVDSDRVQFALEAGYSRVTLTKMKPENCTPKNNLIVAAFSR